jgi:Glycosyltransferase Family 4
MQNHVAELTRCLDRLGMGQLVVTSRLAGPADRARFGAHGQVIRTGLPVPVLRQGWALAAVRHVLGGDRVDLVHVHCGEDLAVLPLARLADLPAGTAWSCWAGQWRDQVRCDPAWSRKGVAWFRSSWQRCCQASPG